MSFLRYPDPPRSFAQSWAASLTRALEDRDRQVQPKLPTGLARFSDDALAALKMRAGDRALAWGDSGSRLLAWNGSGWFPALGAFNARGFGAMGDNVSDDTPAIQAAVDAAVAAGGGVVRIPAGLYRISAPITWDADRVAVEGDGGSTRIIVTGAFNAFTVGGSVLRRHTSLRNMHIEAATAIASGWGFAGRNLWDFDVSGLFVINMPSGLSFQDCTMGQVAAVRVSNIAPDTGVGILIDGGNDQYIRDSLIACAGGAVPQPKCGVLLKASEATWMDAVGALHCRIGCLVQPETGDIVQQCFTTRCAWDSGSSHGLLYAPVGTGIVRTMVSVEDWSATNENHGVAVNAPAGAAVNGLKFIGLRSLNNVQSGVALLSGSNISVSESIISGNSSNVSGAHSGVLVTSGVSEFSITGCDIRPYGPFPNWQKYGVEVQPGASDWYTIAMNRLYGNVTGGLSDGGTGVNKVVGMNL